MRAAPALDAKSSAASRSARTPVDVRGSDPSSRCIVTLELTARGQELVKQVMKRRRRELTRALVRLDPIGRRVWARCLRSPRERLGDS